MKRRDVLVRVGAAGAAVAAAGGLGAAAVDRTALDGALSSDDGDDAGDEESPCRAGRPDWASDEPFDRFLVGTTGDDEAARPSEVWVRNATDETVAVAVDVASGPETLDETVDLPAGAYLEVLAFGDDADVAVESDGSRTRTRVDGSGGWDRLSRTAVTVDEDGIETASRTVRGETPVEDVAFDRLDEACASDEAVERADVAVEDGSVVVEGTIGTPTPCHVVLPTCVAADPDGEVLEVVVAVGESAAEACVECLGEVDYEARVDLADGPPGRVDVRHDRDGDLVDVGSFDVGE
ncbi:hypothetical protein [Salinilacihabitans rarus]|uniref:hypothetical protein n=1 Tax=Salinilacihabitans rarus TaxID=2961596 RepID=UPI0020C91D4D|nr:hypothetical protein [Salinilacihabitans rarus]